MARQAVDVHTTQNTGEHEGFAKCSVDDLSGPWSLEEWRGVEGCDEFVIGKVAEVEC